LKGCIKRGFDQIIVDKDFLNTALFIDEYFFGSCRTSVFSFECQEQNAHTNAHHITIFSVIFRNKIHHISRDILDDPRYPSQLVDEWTRDFGEWACEGAEK